MTTGMRTVGFTTGTAGVIGLRASLDNPSDDPFTRPSVLFGVLSGAAALGTAMLQERGSLGGAVGTVIDTLPPGFLGAHGMSALSAAAVSASYPKKAGDEFVIQRQTVRQRRPA